MAQNLRKKKKEKQTGEEQNRFHQLVFAQRKTKNENVEPKKKHLTRMEIWCLRREAVRSVSLIYSPFHSSCAASGYEVPTCPTCRLST
jgi:hypothetical protein